MPALRIAACMESADVMSVTGEASVPSGLITAIATDVGFSAKIVGMMREKAKAAKFPPRLMALDMTLVAQASCCKAEVPGVLQ